MKRPQTITAVAVALILLAACGGTDTEPDPDDLPANDTGDAPGGDEPDDPGEDDGLPADGGDAGSDPLLGPEIEVAMDDLVERAGVDRADVQILVTELVTWPDGALGCPEPDVMYTQALVDGYQIVLSAGGTEYHYHGASGADPAFCADPTPPAG